MTASRYILCLFALSLCVACSFFTPAAHANTQGDFDKLSGLWVVDYSKTKELWERAKTPNIVVLPVIAQAYMLDMDFSKRTMIEGASPSEYPQRVPFSVMKDEGGGLLIIKDDGTGETKTFLWEMLSDGKAVVTVSKTTPAIIMMKCDYSKYAGKWRFDMPANETLVAMLTEGAEASEIEEFKANLADTYMIFSFSRGDFAMKWETGEGETIYRPFPSGSFTVSQYAERECWLVEENEILLSFKDQDYIIFFFKKDNISMFLKRAAQ